MSVLSERASNWTMPRAGRFERSAHSRLRVRMIVDFNQSDVASSGPHIAGYPVGCDRGAEKSRQGGMFCLLVPRQIFSIAATTAALMEGNFNHPLTSSNTSCISPLSHLYYTVHRQFTQLQLPSVPTALHTVFEHLSARSFTYPVHRDAY